MEREKKIAIIGLGYVGLPLAVEFGKKYKVIGYDINEERIHELCAGIDRTNECSSEELTAAKGLILSNSIELIKCAQIYIVTVPTPVDASKTPDLRPLIKASRTVASVLKKGDIVIYESTVYPGATEEICVSELESNSELKFNQDFFVGYSPERINPGDREHRLTNIKKVVSGSSPDTTREIEKLYGSIIQAGTYRVNNIRVAEAAKVIENTQRDVNIALMNELSLIFNRMNIDTLDVLNAASTKWNFLNFRPGLVGGHCIGVDPYYLTYKAQSLGYTPEIILAGRRINDGMSLHIAKKTIKMMLSRKFVVTNSRVLILGVTFKENCPDLRNSKVFDIVNELEDYGANVDVFDPWVDSLHCREKYGVNCLSTLPNRKVYSAVIVAVNHSQFFDVGIKGIKAFCKSNAVLFDVKGMFPSEEVDARL